MQKYGQLANNAVKEPFTCLVCGNASGFNWSDYHGEGMCNSCGTPYNLLVNPPSINLIDVWIPVLKEYWEKTHAYTGLGTICCWGDYPECVDGNNKLSVWIKENHPELYECEANK